MDEDKKNSILIIDDDKLVIMDLIQILASDYTVYAIKNGLDAVEEAESLLPDLILLDIIMPETDGYAVITALKNSKKAKDIPVIFISGLSDDKDKRKGLDLGGVDFINKPFSPDIIKSKVKNQIEKA